ncbi:MAG: hypothetical protein M3167_06080 [Acidobacteriota bacterium]|nr:hypothetical protein [Acidobacteriota bacterium]
MSARGRFLAGLVLGMVLEAFGSGACLWGAITLGGFFGCVLGMLGLAIAIGSAASTQRSIDEFKGRVRL